MPAKCASCSANWSIDEYSEGCPECGGFALTRHCPICNGKCGAIFRRNIGMSNTCSEAYYSGSCQSSNEESKTLSYLSDDEIIRRSQTIYHGAESQRDAIFEARKRGIFDPLEHIKNSPVVKGGLVDKSNK